LAPSPKSTRPTRLIRPTSAVPPQLPGSETPGPLEAAVALAGARLVVLPTETVYGLGGLANSPTAVADIFRVKGRPSRHPVIVHVSGREQIAYWSRTPPATALAVAEAFWPGPITVVVPKADTVLAAVTGGQDTVALRAPAHPLFIDVLAQLEELGIDHPGIAAPSANRFGQVSPTTAEHVRTALGEYLGPQALILDGGTSSVGIESTIVLCGSDGVSIARHGGISATQLEHVVPVISGGDPSSGQNGTPRVPGSLASHYAPKARVYIADFGIDGECEIVTEKVENNKSVGVIGLSQDVAQTPSEWHRLSVDGPIEDLDCYARQLYAALRRADDLGLRTVVALLPPADATGLGPAIRDRLQRAAD
jgi:L-threonylcarbamoyladenylate synthase